MSNTNIKDPAEILERVEKLLIAQEWQAWFIANVIEFMAAALPEDSAGELSTRCTLLRLQEQAAELAESLGNLMGEARHG